MTDHDVVLHLYVAGDTARSHAAAGRVRRLLEECAPGRGRLEIIDVLERPDLAEANRIIATPYLVKLSPPPVRRLVGDLSDMDLARTALDLDLMAEDR